MSWLYGGTFISTLFKSEMCWKNPFFFVCVCVLHSVVGVDLCLRMVRDCFERNDDDDSFCVRLKCMVTLRICKSIIKHLVKIQIVQQSIRYGWTFISSINKVSFVNVSIFLPSYCCCRKQKITKVNEFLMNPVIHSFMFVANVCVCVPFTIVLIYAYILVYLLFAHLIIILSDSK